MPFGALTSTNGLIWKNKLLGFFGIRMDMRFRLVANANKFQQGRYIIGWTPTGSPAINTSNLKALKFVQAHNATLMQRTTVHHAELDLATQSVAELLVPYSSNRAYYPLSCLSDGIDHYGLGYLSIYPYSPLLAPTGSTTCGYTLYVSFENVSFYGAASPQGMGKKKHHQGLSAREVSNKQNGPISGIAGAISRGFNEFSSIPMIGEFATGVSWISDRIASTASIFGFSKPTAGDCVPKMHIVNAPSHSTVDGDSNSRALSYLNQPGVVPIKGLAGTEYDEMDFSFIKSRYAWFRTFTWTTSSVSGATLSTFLNFPGLGDNIVSFQNFNNHNYTPVAFLARNFELWRGSLKFRFKIVKTEFHSGRLQFAFYPGSTGATLIGSESYVNRVIIDIREHSEVELTIPYMALNPWSLASENTGSLIITVVDELVAPASVAAQVSVLCEMCGGDDFEVAVPVQFTATPTVLVPQGMDKVSVAENIYSATIGNAKVDMDAHIMTSIAIGDKVSSARALLKRFEPWMRSPTSTTVYNGNVRIVQDVVHYHIADDLAVLARGILADKLSLWASCYLYMSGGIRIRDVLNFGMIANDKSMHSSVVGMLTGTGSANGSMFSSTGVLFKESHMVLQDCYNNNEVTFEIPQYTATFARNIVDVTLFQSSTNPVSDQYATGSRHQLTILPPANLNVTPVTGQNLHKIYRAGADDFQLSGFISIPPMRPVNPTDSFANY